MHHPVVLRPPSEIDVATGLVFAADLAGACASPGAAVVVDFSDVTFCDSTAVLVLVNAVTHARACGCELEVRNPTRMLRVMAHALGLSEVLPLSS